MALVKMPIFKFAMSKWWVRKPNLNLGVPAKAESISFTLNLPGTHNVLNAVAAVIVALQLDVKEKYITRSVRKFSRHCTQISNLSRNLYRWQKYSIGR